jgi:hypothetical protein
MTSGKALYIMDGKDVAIALAVMTNQLFELSMLHTVCVQVGSRFLVDRLLLTQHPVSGALGWSSASFLRYGKH